MAAAIMTLSACGPESSPPARSTQPTATAPAIGVRPITATEAPLGVTLAATAARPTPAPPTTTSAPGAKPTFDPSRCPLTGLPVRAIDWSQRRAILVQIGNSPPERPQSQLSLADVVFEHYAEGGLTRFSAVYLCNDAATSIGPVRSGRLINLDNVPMMNAIFVHIGASDGVLARFDASEVNQAKFDEYVGDPGITRLTTRQPPFNAYTSVTGIWALARDRGWLPGPQTTVLKFGAAPASGGSPAARIDLPIRPGVTDVSYAYDGVGGAYLRSMGGFPHIDLSTGQQLAAANVLVIYATHTETDIIEDSLGSRSIQIDLSSGGRAQLLRDGQVYEGAWSRPDAHAFFELTDTSGQPLLLKPGITWIQIVPTDFVVTIE
jgi:hypothetical protein